VFRGPVRDAEPEVAAAPVRDPEIQFVAYSEDCLLSGRIRLSEERLSDLLNDHESFELVDVLVTPLDGSHAIELRELLVARDELVLVHASGPRGNAGRRHRTRTHPIVVNAPPYEVHGYIHTTPGGDPISSFRRRKPMVALSDATVRYAIGGRTEERRVGTLVINRELADWVAEGKDEKVATLDVPAEKGPLVKDFTGELLSD
jgi:hypothetical protein